MAVYNGGFPMCYQPMYQPYTQPYTQMQNQPQNVAPVQQNGGFVRVQNENEARMYPVAPGNSVTFINENAPYCYTKSVEMSQLDRPKFEKYRLVKEEEAPPEQAEHRTEYVLKDELYSEIERLEKMITERSSNTRSLSDRFSQRPLDAPSVDTDSVMKG